MSDALDTLQRRLDYVFADPALLVLAMTHRSASHRNNERLEFLGDGLLNFVIGEALYQCKPRDEEGALSRLRASLVREASLASVARSLNLGDCIHFGESEQKSGGFRRDSILADALEALFAAIYLDRGFASAQAVILRVFQAMLDDLPDPEQLKDAKTRLQEWLQARGRPLPVYRILSESGPPHARRFQVVCALAEEAETAEPPAEIQAQAQGSSRRVAEQRAAESLLQRLEAASDHA